ncbi:MAG: CHAP domain-containing protein [Streptococcaceae bacterium]|nr:CHAP domain-containing protein [Streptococcaceae bacterium]MCL2680994.1 CHAP domain-containing protein [Streptococcaceae bacterium]MCL2858714.1 CHAP domain-containing protein [Streptococcaceae bacterium]
MKKKLLFTALIGLILSSNAIQVEAVTQSQAISWLQSSNGKYYDFDGAYGYQCVDFVRSYGKFLGQDFGGGISYAYQLANNNYASYTKYNGNANIQAGDIVILSATPNNGNAGHTGVVVVVESTGKLTVAEQNYLYPGEVNNGWGNNPVRIHGGHDRNNYNMLNDGTKIIASFRPTFTNGQPLTVQTPSTKKTNVQIADEVIAGKWGYGDDRKIKLTQAGYDYNTIQALVNKKLGF